MILNFFKIVCLYYNVDKADDPECQKILGDGRKHPGVCELLGYLENIREHYESSRKRNNTKNLKKPILPNSSIISTLQVESSNKIS